MNKICFVGELNPYGADPTMALYPLPREASGNRLRSYLRLEDREYIYQYDRVNLCTRVWKMPAARAHARELIDARLGGGYALVLCGAKVASAFDLPFTPGQIFYPPDGQPAILVVPHPSGRNRVWNDPDVVIATRKAFEALQRHVAGVPA